ncbi:phosphonate metabolism protein PhnP [Pollutimonas bauzanensis]|uniref:Phosphoribosyl 1,2-cyclic phosphate phosphodiesterase n=1 Tax=Pollutimonas bauzanensis TaxID=658167 RepID=A0A1M5MDY6_9BURK|nr:phosphonate metabolism protein PhnP [Pollutimonas bauzanensis]SHG74913.1 phosphoribosyl 1,2-cyclic phosphate phosphodiesterase [Pollutimonas bauzanensis]
MRLSLLGTGDAAQVPVYNCHCPACDRARREACHRRGPCSALMECGGARWLVDAGLTDLAERFAPGSLDGIVQTHYHADHAQGLLHLRWGRGMRIPVLGPDDPDGFADLYKHPGILDFSQKLNAFQTLTLAGFSLTPLPLCHSRPTFGYVFADGSSRIAYLTDTVGLPPATAAYLKERPLDLLVMDCSFPPLAQAPRNHNDLTRALDVIASLPVKKTVLTHIGHDFDTWLMAHRHELPQNVSVGFDGDVLAI